MKCWRGVVDEADGIDRDDEAAAPRPGTILSAGASGIHVACGRGAFLLTELQRAGGRRVSAAEFLQRTPLLGGEVLGATPRAGPLTD